MVKNKFIIVIKEEYSLCLFDQLSKNELKIGRNYANIFLSIIDSIKWKKWNKFKNKALLRFIGNFGSISAVPLTGF